MTTAKQIIIDGIDVSGCGYYTDSKCTNSYIAQSNCKNVAVCYYKEYKRSEAQCEAMFITHTDLEKKYKAKERECERLKEERDTWHYQWEKRYEICESLSDDIDKLCEQLDQLKVENKELKKQYNIYTCGVCGNKDECNKLKQTLTEIKEIAEIAVNFCKGCGGEDYECIDCTNGGRAQISKEILQKISEVE